MGTARILATAALLIGGLSLGVGPAQATCVEVNGCTNTVGQVPPPPTDGVRPPQLPPPGLDNSPCQACQAPAAPAPVYQAPAPVYQAPAAPQPAYKAPAAPVAPAPVYIAPVPVQGQAAITQGQSAVVPAAIEAEAVVAPESAQGEHVPAVAPDVAATPSVDAVAAPISEQVEAKGGPVAADVSPASSASDNTPIIIGVASVIVIGGVVWLVLHTGPGVAGIRGIARGLLRR
jgi:hypothetical protein